MYRCLMILDNSDKRNILFTFLIQGGSYLKLANDVTQSNFDDSRKKNNKIKKASVLPGSAHHLVILGQVVEVLAQLIDRLKILGLSGLAVDWSRAQPDDASCSRSTLDHSRHQHHHSHHLQHAETQASVQPHRDKFSHKFPSSLN